MTLMKTLRDRLAKRAAYNRTYYALSQLPAEYAMEDLGICIGDAKKIATRAVYG